MTNGTVPKTVTVTVIPVNGGGYQITINPYRVVVSIKAQDVIEWQVGPGSEVEISIIPERKEHFRDLVPGSYGRRHGSGPIKAPEGVFHYTIGILVPDQDPNRTSYKDTICIDPDYKVVP